MKLLLIIVLMFCSGCTNLAVAWTPAQVKSAIMRGYAVSQIATEQPPEGENLQNYLKINNELWKELAEFYEVK